MSAADGLSDIMTPEKLTPWNEEFQFGTAILEGKVSFFLLWNVSFLQSRKVVVIMLLIQKK